MSSQDEDKVSILEIWGTIVVVIVVFSVGFWIGTMS